MQNQFIVTESFLSHHTNVNTPSWIDDIVNNGDMVWKDGRVLYREPGGNFSTVGIGDVFVRTESTVVHTCSDIKSFLHKKEGD